MKVITDTNWRKVLSFSHPKPWMDLKNEIHKIPPHPGIYLFTTDSTRALQPGPVLYVGKADQLTSTNGLQDRVGGYLTKRNKHNGALFLYKHVEKSGSSKVFIRWAVWDQPVDYEGEVQADLNPQFCSRIEKPYHTDG